MAQMSEILEGECRRYFRNIVSQITFQQALTRIHKMIVCIQTTACK